jgi:hypothetical protein
MLLTVIDNNASTLIRLVTLTKVANWWLWGRSKAGSPKPSNGPGLGVLYSFVLKTQRNHMVGVRGVHGEAVTPDFSQIMYLMYF